MADGRSPGFSRAARGATAVALTLVGLTAVMVLTRADRAGLVVERAASLTAITGGAVSFAATGLRCRGADRTWRWLLAVFTGAAAIGGALLLAGVVRGGPAVPALGPGLLVFLPPWVAGVLGVLRYPTEPLDGRWDAAQAAAIDLARPSPTPRPGAERLPSAGAASQASPRWAPAQRPHLGAFHLATTALDALQVVGAAALLTWSLVLRDMAEKSGVLTGQFLYTAVVAGAFMLLCAAVVLVATFRRPRPVAGLATLGLGFLVLTVGVAWHLSSRVHAESTAPAPVELTMVAGCALVALAAFTPPAAAVPRRVPARAPAGDRRLAAPGGAGQSPSPRRRRAWAHASLPYLVLLLACAGLLGSLHWEPHVDDPQVWGLLGLFILALARQMVTVAHNMRLVDVVVAGHGALRRQARLDPLTGLANRGGFNEGLAAVVARAGQNHHRLCVLFCDLDHFKQVNDTLGHEAGDDLLRVIARRLRGAVRETDLVSRLGGDEFALVVERAHDTADPSEIGWRIARAVRAPVRLAGTTYQVTASVGLVDIDPARDPVSPEELLRRADLAMYAAKAGPRDALVVYDPSLAKPETEAALRATLAAALRGEPEGGVLDVVFRPVVALGIPESPGGPVLAGWEARTRWVHPRLGERCLTDLLSAEESVGLTPAVDSFTLRAACAALARRVARAGTEPATAVHVTVSAAYVADEGFAGQVLAVLHETGLAPTGLVIAVRGSTRAPDLAATARGAEQLRALGVRTCIADIGGVGASLATVFALQVAEIARIDPELTRAWTGPPDAPRALFTDRLLTALRKDLGLRIFAAGVSDRRTENMLCVLGCDLAAGPLYGPWAPLPDDGEAP